jgi:hypothetical protein
MNAVARSVPMRAKVERLERELEKLPQVDCPVRHHFEPGSYSRAMTIPAGVVATGAVHKTEHWTFVLGHCLLTTDQGVKEFKGAHAFVSKPGAKRAVRAIKETIVMTVHHTEERDLDKLCLLLTESKPAELLGGRENRQLLANKAKELQ